jgi:hypothetical protein
VRQVHRGRFKGGSVLSFKIVDGVSLLEDLRPGGVLPVSGLLATNFRD